MCVWKCNIALFLNQQYFIYIGGKKNWNWREKKCSFQRKKADVSNPSPAMTYDGNSVESARDETYHNDREAFWKWEERSEDESSTKL